MNTYLVKVRLPSITRKRDRMQFSSVPRSLGSYKGCLPIHVLVMLLCAVTAYAQEPRLNEETSRERQALLTCTFSENVDDKRQPFKILNDQSEIVLKCSWGQGALYCNVRDNYSYDWTRSDKVTVKKFRGHPPSSCSCYLVDLDKTEYKRPCTVEDSEEHEDIIEEYKTQPVGVGDNLSSQLPPSDAFSSDDPDWKAEKTFLLAGVCLAAIVLTLFFVALFILIRRRCFVHKSNENISESTKPFVDRGISP